ncbi:hypothetical protein L7F22_035519 [Adiantum nelumboides]|nr:hypothetical protein [Adiantum nelumboides]
MRRICPHVIGLRQRNGVAKRKDMHIAKVARALMSEKNMPPCYWAEVASTAVYTMNKTPTAIVHDMTLEEKFTGKKPDVSHFKVFGCVSHFKVFGCVAYVHVPDELRTKRDPKAEKCVFIGYSVEQKGYKCYNPVTRHVRVRRDVVFDEMATWYAEVKVDLGADVKSVAENNFDVQSQAAMLQTHEVENCVKKELASEWEATRLEALRWIFILLERHRTEVISNFDSIFPPLLQALADSSDEVVLLVLDIHACIARDKQQFRQLMVFLVHRFRTDQTLLEKRGTLIVRTLCVLLDAKKIYKELATILEGEADLEFATTMVQALNLILLTASELTDLRALLKHSLSNADGRSFFVELYSTWCHSPMATISLCLLVQAYQHATSVIQSLGEEDVNVRFLVQVDKLVRLLETPIFTYLRLQLLDPGRYPALLKALNGLLMLLPQQSMAFKILKTRLKTVPAYPLMHVSPPTTSEFPGLGVIRRTASGSPYAQLLSHSQISEDGDGNSDFGDGAGAVDFQAKLQQFRGVQHQHREHMLSQRQQLKYRRGPLEPTQGSSQRHEESRGGNAVNDGSSKILPRVGWHS